MVREISLHSAHDGEPTGLIGQMLKIQDIVMRGITLFQYRVIQTFGAASVVLLLLWISAFLYGSLYYSYMPNVSFSAPVYYYHRTDCQSPASLLCSYPVANVSLMRNRKHVLTFGQAYRISLMLEIPDSPINQALGMFMIKMTFFSQDGGQVASSAHPARQVVSASSSRFSMLRYRTDLVRLLETMLFLPAFLTGASEQKQMLDVELFSDYTDDPYSPSVTAVIEILSDKVQIYTSQLHFSARFTGIRYLLFGFPLLSAVVGVSTNFFFLCVIFILSYLRLFTAFRAPQPIQTDRLLPEGENMNSNQQEDEREAAAESKVSNKVSSTNPREESHTGNDVECTSDSHGQSEINESEAA